MEKLKVAKVLEIPSPAEPNTIYFEKGTTDTSFKIAVTDQEGGVVEMESEKPLWNDGAETLPW